MPVMISEGRASEGGAPAEPSKESLCRKCGRCCCRKFIIGEHVYFTPFFCTHLDPQTRRCKVYPHRFKVNPICIPAERGIARGVFPSDCPYVAGREDYQPPVEELDFFGLGELAREIAMEIGVDDEEFERVRREHLENKGKKSVSNAG